MVGAVGIAIARFHLQIDNFTGKQTIGYGKFHRFTAEGVGIVGCTVETHPQHVVGAAIPRKVRNGHRQLVQEILAQKMAVRPYIEQTVRRIGYLKIKRHRIGAVARTVARVHHQIGDVAGQWNVQASRNGKFHRFTASDYRYAIAADTDGHDIIGPAIPWKIWNGQGCLFQVKGIQDYAIGPNNKGSIAGIGGIEVQAQLVDTVRCTCACLNSNLGYGTRIKW